MNSTARGIVGAMAMTGVRSFTQIGLVGQTPPEAVLQQKLGGLMGRIPEQRQQGVIEAFHWSTGAVGATFGCCPGRRDGQAGGGRRAVRIGCLFSGFEMAAEPLLGLE